MLITLNCKPSCIATTNVKSLLKHVIFKKYYPSLPRNNFNSPKHTQTSQPNPLAHLYPNKIHLFLQNALNPLLISKTQQQKVCPALIFYTTRMEKARREKSFVWRRGERKTKEQTQRNAVLPNEVNGESAWIASVY